MWTKRFIPLFLALLVFFSNTGMVLSMHFCKGEVEKISVHHLENSHCEKESSPKKCCADGDEMDDCCSDKAVQEQLVDKQSPDILKIQFVDFTGIKPIQNHDEFFFFQNLTALHLFNNHFIESNAPPIYLQHQQLILYA